MIKLDIINRLADETGIPKLKAEQAVEALFNSMKDALSRGDRIELRGFGVFIVKPRSEASDAIRALVKKWQSLWARRFDSSPAKNFRATTMTEEQSRVVDTRAIRRPMFIVQEN